MKKKIPIIILLLSSFLCSAQFRVYIPINNNFIEKDISDVGTKNISEISKYLGYNREQFYTDSSDSNLSEEGIYIVLFKVFTDDVICIIAHNQVDSINKKVVDHYLLNFNFKDKFDDYNIEKTLNNAVKNKSLTLDYLSEIFNKKNIDKNGSFTVKEFGYNLIFTNGILTNFTSSDGLSKWGKMWKNDMPITYNKYRQAAENFWDNEESITNEINTQADAFVRLEDGNSNEYSTFHVNSDGTINYKMLLVAHYNEKITLKEFKVINHGRYKIINEFNTNNQHKRAIYKVNETFYTFDENGNLINSYSSE